MTADRPLFHDPEAPFRKRVDDLLARLTTDERITLLHQFAPAVERLGLAAFRTGQEALHGVAWMGPATVFPQAVGLGATWNEDLVRRVGAAVATEARAMRARDDRVGLNIWAPTVNLLRNPLWGRNEEGYSEDPQLTSAIAGAYTRGLRGDHPVYWRTAPVLKHWLAHNNETDRDTSSASVRPRVLHEYDLRAFRGAVEAGSVAGVMPAYNLVNGRPNHLSPYLRTQLRTWTDQDLLVCSDAGAPSNLVDSEHYFELHEHATAAALLAGVDSFTDHGTDGTAIVARLRGALAQGLISEADIDTAVRRQLHVRFRLGEFDPQQDPYADVRDHDTPAHRELAREAAEQAVVLLKNDGLLPLAASGDSRIAVIGLLADACKLDWYSGTLIHLSTPLDGLRMRFGTQNVVYAEGADRIRISCAAGRLRVLETDPEDRVRGAEGALDPALLAGRTDLPPLTTDAAGTELALVDWGDGLLTLRAPDGRHLSVADDGYVRASADQPGGWVVQETFRLERPNGTGQQEGTEQQGRGHLLRHMGTGRYVTVAADGVKVADRGDLFEIEIIERGEDAVARAAAQADVVIVVAGNDPHINGRETEDRTTLALPEHQDRLWRAAHAANPRTVLALTSSYPYAIPEAAAELPALLWTAHGGQAAGTALARVLAGDVSPAGRLPQTWYGSDADLSGMLDYDIIGSRQTYLYYEGEPLFPFGHGLSYSSFSYNTLEVVREGAALRVAFTVANTGDRPADEVAQLYARAVDPSVPRPRRQLAGHRRIHLAPGASRRLEFTVPITDLGFWDVGQGRWIVEPGRYEFLVGASSADIRIAVTVDVDGAPTTPALPRPVLEHGLGAVDYDEQRGTVIADETKVAGDCVTPAGPEPGELLYRRCDFGPGTRRLRLRYAAQEPGSIRVTLTDGSELAAVDLPATGGPYDSSTLDAEFTGITVSGVHDVRLELRGPLRLAHLGFSG
ncbi:glycoside hydrolase family 3 C-terminal domain-containing protein [Streptomyces sp. KR80]|uniref:glycoside hydrolase family 3 C-terminal domain-containing protein n=1 Tax=Streptomyces sp. KR80 TaxID=3457426 RepID=UPI003FD11D8D